MQVDLNKLKTFYILAGTKSYTRCAEKVFITQSAVSHAIKKLESELGYELVDRKNRQFRLTRQGEFLYQQCSGIFNRIDTVLGDLAQQQAHPVFIKLGAPVEFGSSVLMNQMGSFLNSHQEYHIDFLLDPYLLEPLLADELDIIVDCIPHVHEDLVSVFLCDEEYVVIATPGYISQKNVRQVKDLNRCSLLSFDRNLFWWRNFINALTETDGFGFDRIVRISNVRAMINAAVQSLGIGFVPRYTVADYLETGTLEELFTDTDILSDQINVYLKKRNFEKQVFKDLIAHIKTLQLS